MEFVLKRFGPVEFWAATDLGAPHGFSTRVGGVSDGIYESLNLGLRRGDREDAVRENYRRFLGAIGAEGLPIVTADQVHSAQVRAVTAADAKGDLMDPAPFACDALVTDVPGVVLTVFTADCVPILLCDAEHGVVGAVHAGWRGTVAGIAARAVRAMVALGADAGCVRGAIGPAIGPCCFETGPEVPQAVRDLLGRDGERFIRPAGREGKYLVDVKGVNRAALESAGVAPDHLAVSDECTYCHPERYWSHRYTRGERGSMAAMIYLEQGAKG